MTKTRGKTPVRGIRVHDDLWLPAQAIAKLRDEDVSDAAREGIERYVRRHRHLLDDPKDGGESS